MASPLRGIMKDQIEEMNQLGISVNHGCCRTRVSDQFVFSFANSIKIPDRSKRLVTPSRTLSTNKFSVANHVFFPKLPTGVKKKKHQPHSLQKSECPDCFGFWLAFWQSFSVLKQSWLTYFKNMRDTGYLNRLLCCIFSLILYFDPFRSYKVRFKPITWAIKFSNIIGPINIGMVKTEVITIMCWQEGRA